ncbi:MAG: hypothetical protein RI894_1587 [Bacteroidota bacterium]|jgi:uncharacterized protein (TIGR02117 family)
MLKRLFNVLKYALYTLFGIIVFLAVYVVAVFTLPEIAVNKAQTPTPADTIGIYILTNGVHTDIVAPIRNEQRDWTTSISFENTASKDTAMNYTAFGWGDKGFYLDTPSWAELKFSTAFKAAFYLSTAAMHTTFYKEMKAGESCRKINITKAEYQQLIDYIDNSFERDDKGKVMNIVGHSYGKNDAFYEAKGKYSLFHTCNTWANNGLKSCEQRACLWTPRDKGIFSLYPLK